MTGLEFNPMWSMFGEVLSMATGVFYNMLTYTWSQELQPDLLDLFDRYVKQWNLSVTRQFETKKRLSSCYYYSLVKGGSTLYVELVQIMIYMLLQTR